ncbi:hypothetical protein [Streptomyces griseus]|uniref:hypothetical protein n=1 Tax=Streptomyces griseus TaxID=1911 RepID=UPI00069088E6|nr:hypothetical protein [Streptomyces griseus]
MAREAAPGERRTGPGRTRRRGAAPEEAFLEAAARELTESGFATMTMTVDKVAARARAHKNTLCRPRPNRPAPGTAAYKRLAAPVPDSGTLCGDVLVEITDEVRPPLVRGRGAAPRGADA